MRTTSPGFDSLGGFLLDEFTLRNQIRLDCFVKCCGGNSGGNGGGDNGGNDIESVPRFETAFDHLQIGFGHAQHDLSGL